MRLNELRTIILECQAMTGQRFGQWLYDLISDIDPEENKTFGVKLWNMPDWKLANLVKDLTPLNTFARFLHNEGVEKELSKNGLKLNDDAFYYHEDYGWQVKPEYKTQKTYPVEKQTKGRKIEVKYIP